MTQPRITAASLREWAVESHSDPRTVRNVLLGKRVKGMVDERIRRVLSARGIAVPPPQEPSTADHAV